jgi:hypothetical protein
VNASRIALAARWEDRAERDLLAAAWRERRSLRIEGLLAGDTARALRDALRGEPHVLAATRPPDFAYQYRSSSYAPEDACDHLLCHFGRWWWSEGVAFVSAVTGMALRPPPDRILTATLYGRGSYLDAHNNDHDGVRRCAFVLGLTEEIWPAEDGGHLEFLGVRDGAVHVLERRAPGWNTLDLFDVTGIERIHQVPVITRAVQRRTFAGWFY